ncbi:MAG: ribosome biogenesis GTPase Der [Proteobacteria bacterium]|nr:ribosome biogenesis GTPase Der [Pseudomonadota bacterium]
MIPCIAIIGRPNVGKSTLFNCLTHSRQALVVDQPGVTRDRQFGQGYLEDQHYIVVDSGGIGESASSEIDLAMLKQARLAMVEADLIFFVVDARQGLTQIDQQIAKELRKQNKPVILVINKTDGLDAEVVKSDFYRLGFKNMATISASHNRGIESLLLEAFETLPHEEEPEQSITEEQAHDDVPKVAIIGRPNVGKSTLVNRMLGEERVIVCDMPGTTRDSIHINMKRMGKAYMLIDTAGVRKNKVAMDVVEKFSALKTLQAIKEANVVLLVFDAKIGLTDQDLSLISFTVDAGKCLIICANKWDGMDSDEKEQVKSQLSYRLKFADFAPIHTISALHGTGVGDLFKTIDKVYKSANKELDTKYLTEILETAIESHQPPLVRGKRIKLRYAHCGGHNPPTIVIHGNQTDELPQSYQKYLSNYFIKTLKLEGTPVKIICKSGQNPFAHKRNTLTPRQIYKKRRLMKYVKKSG